MRRVLAAGAVAGSLIVIAAGGAPSAYAAGRYDGTWVGPVTVTANSSPFCGKGGTRELHIVDNKFSFEIGGTPMNGTVGPDGRFSASGVWQGQAQRIAKEFSGKISGDKLDATVTWPQCTGIYSLHRQ